MTEEATRRSALMETAFYLTDVYGPRLTGLAPPQGRRRFHHSTPQGMGPGERPIRAVGPVRPGLDNRPLYRARHFANALSTGRLSEGLDSRHRGRGRRRSGAGRHREGQRFRGLPGQAARPVRADRADHHCSFRPTCRGRIHAIRTTNSRRDRAIRSAGRRRSRPAHARPSSSPESAWSFSSTRASRR